MNSNHQPVWNSCLQGEKSSAQAQPTNSVAELDSCQLEKHLSEIRAELETYRTLYEHLPTIYLTLDSAGIIVVINQFGATRLGYLASELIANSFFNLVDAEDKGTLQAKFSAFVQNQLSSDCVSQRETYLENSEFRLHRQQGDRLWVKMTACVVKKHHVNPEIIVVCEDITECKQGEKALQKSEEMFRLLFENSLDAIVITDNQGHYVRVNQAAGELLGYSQEQLLQMSVADLVTTESISAAEQYQAYTQVGYELGEFSFIRADGERRIAEYSACQFTTTLNLAILRDITDRKQAEQALLDDANRLYAINATLHDIVTADLDLNRIMDLIVERTQQLTNATGTAIEVIEGEEMVYRAATGTAANYVGLRLQMNASLSGQCVQRREILSCEDTETDSRVDRAACRRIGVRSMVVVPLYHGRKVVGVLKVLSSKTHAFGYGEIYTLQLMTRLLAAAMSHASEFEAKQTALEALQASEERFRKLNEQLEIIVEERTAALKTANQQLQIEIEERQQTELALRMSEAKNRALLSALPDLILRISKDNIYLDFKAPRGFDLLLHPKEFIGKSLFEVLPEEIAQSCQYYIEQSLATGEMQLFEYQLPNKDCKVRDYEARLVLCKADEVLAIVRDITQRKAAEAALQQQTEREQVVSAIAQRIRQSLNLKDILNTTVAEVRQFLQTERVIIFRFQPDWSGIVVVESVADGWLSILNQKISDLCFEKRYVSLYQQGRIKAIADIYTAGLAECHLRLLSQLQVRANLIVPILQGNTLWGLLIAHHCAAPRQWQSLEIDLLSSLATQVAIAIQQSELYQQVQQLNSDLERQVQERTVQLQQALDLEAMLKRVTDKVRDSLDESQILQTAVQELALGLKVGRCDTALYDLEAGTATIRYAYTISMPASQQREYQTAEFSEFYHQLRQGEYFQFCKWYPSQDWVAALACPIFDDQGMLGDLWLFKHKEAAFSELEIRLVQQVANQCAIAIRQARLYQAEQAQVKELEKLNHLKDDFLNTVSHELRTPISNMNMAIQMLEITLKREGLFDQATSHSKTEVNKLT